MQINYHRINHILLIIMKKKTITLLTGMLISACWMSTLGQETPTIEPLQRLRLTLVDNESDFSPVDMQNTYKNTLRLSQPEGDCKFSAGLLKQGDNYITITRQGNSETQAAEVARVNLQADIVKREDAQLSYLELTSTTVNQDGWTYRGIGRTGTNGNYRYYIQSGDNNHLTYTIPAGYEKGTIMLYIATYTAGYFKINGTQQSQTTANAWNQYFLTDLGSGDQIKIQGCNSSGGNANSPNIGAIYVFWYPKTIVPSISITPLLSMKQGDNWGTATTLGTTVNYQPNDLLDFDGTHIDIVDEFIASIDGNQLTSSYGYLASLDANIDWTTADMTGDFYASIDFTAGDGESLSTAERVGPDNWEYQLTIYYTPSDPGVHALFLDETADFIYTMPNNFASNTVNVTVTSITGSYGSGNVVVNGENHNFTAGSSHTWTLPVSANGVVRLQMAENDNYTCGITKVVIQSGSGNGTAKAPQSQPAVSRLQRADKPTLLNDNGLKVISKSLSIKK